jgi:hypothetical protein
MFFNFVQNVQATVEFSAPHLVRRGETELIT